MRETVLSIKLTGRRTKNAAVKYGIPEARSVKIEVLSEDGSK